MKLAFFDTKPYDIPGFDRYAAGTELEIKYFETRLNEDTVSLAAGFDGICVFVNDIVNAAVVDKLYSLVPEGLNKIVTRAMIEEIVQSTFNEIEEYARTTLDKAVDKINVKGE